jgi:hypothetical protein
MPQQTKGSSPQFKTLQLHSPIGRTLPVVVMILALLVLTAEALIRPLTGRFGLTMPSLGLEHTQFEDQWFRVKAYARLHGSVDCIVLGDSSVMTNFSPGDFGAAYFETTGQSLDCINFGAGGLSAVGLETASRLLIQEYQPQFLLVGVEALNFTVPYEEQNHHNITDHHWTRYKLGQFSPLGWMYEHIYLAQYGALLGQLITFTGNHALVVRLAAGDTVSYAGGYYAVYGSEFEDMSLPPDPNSDSHYVEHYYAAMGDFRMYPENLEAFDRLLALDSPKTRVIIVEMPVPDSFYPFFGRGELDYRWFVNTVNAASSAAGVPFWRIEDPQWLPYTAWFNYNHLNADGAQLFSAWLGQKLGEAIAAGIFHSDSSISGNQ